MLDSIPIHVHYKYIKHVILFVIIAMQFGLDNNIIYLFDITNFRHEIPFWNLFVCKIMIYARDTL